MESLDEQSEFEKGRNAYRAKQYDEADARFLRMLDPEHGTLHDKVLIKQARMYWAATRLAMHHDEDAAAQFRIILSDDPHYEPDPLVFPTEVGNAFIDTRVRYRAELEEREREQYRIAAERRATEEAARKHEAARLKALEKMAGEVEVTEKHSRWVALLPFGVGQFQNGQRRLGYFFLTTEATLVAAGIATVPIYYVDLSNANDTYAGNHLLAQQYLDRANAVRYVNLSLYAALAVTVISGAIEGEVAYVPDPIRVVPRVVPELSTPATPSAPAPSAAPATLSSFSLPFSLNGGPLPGRDGHGVSGGTVGLAVSF